MRKHPLIVTTVVLLLFGVATFALGADDPFNGTWKLNVAKSKFPPGREPKSQIRTIEIKENRLRDLIDTVGPDGNATHSDPGFAILDGKEYPAPQSAQGGETMTMAWTRIDAHTIDSVFKRAGQIIATNHGVVSTDGKTLTISSKQKGRNGEEFERISFYDKQ